MVVDLRVERVGRLLTLAEPASRPWLIGVILPQFRPPVSPNNMPIIEPRASCEPLTPGRLPVPQVTGTAGTGKAAAPDTKNAAFQRRFYRQIP